MLISLNWLKKFLKEVPETKALVHGLTMSGLEVEKTEKIRDEAGLDDLILEIGLTPNRSDAFSHFGVAREWSALSGTATVEPELLELKKGNCPVRVVIDDPEACHRYAGLVMENVQVKPSPKWMQRDLKSIGIEPINNVVDVTNYVLHSIGQPLHAFDLEAFPEKEVRIGTLRAGTVFKTLDGVERKLLGSETMICHKQTGLCMAGIFGGAESGVRPGTKAIFLESATFDPARTRKSARAHQLNTDASFRYERGTDPEINVRALQMAALLLKEVAGATVVGGYADENPKPYKAPRIRLTPEQVQRLSGMDWNPKEIEAILSRLGYQVQAKGKEWEVQVPGYRTGMEWPQDLIEELLRIKGLDAVPVRQEMAYRPVVKQGLDREVRTYELKQFWAHKGFMELQANSLVPREQENGMPLSNPLSRELKQLRTTLMYSGLEAIHYNYNRGRERFRFFETGKVYRSLGKQNFLEEEQLGLWISGPSAPLHFKGAPEAATQLHLKGAIEDLFRHLGSDTANRIKQSAEGPQLIWTMDGQQLAWMSQVPPRELHSDIKEVKVYYGCVLLEPLLTLVERTWTRKFLKPTRFPVVTRDLAFIVRDEVHYARIQELIQKAGTPLLQDLQLFDEFKGKSLPEGSRSLAVRMRFSDPSRTLTEAEINKPIAAIMQALEREIGATVRTA